MTEDRWLLWCVREHCEERDAGGGAPRTSASVLRARVQEDGVSYYYAKDHLGSVREMTDVGGRFGRATTTTPTGGHKTTGDKDTPFAHGPLLPFA